MRMVKIGVLSLQGSVEEHLAMLKRLPEVEGLPVKNKQALEMVEMHRNILESMMDAFASIISNNLNMVMKFLTSMTIILAIPTMIASFWGMNVPVPMAHTHHYAAFILIIITSFIGTSIVAAILAKKNLF